MFDSTKVKDSDGDKWYAIDNYLTLLARIFISALFIWSGTNKIMHPVATQENMSAHGMPFIVIPINFRTISRCHIKTHLG